MSFFLLTVILHGINAFFTDRPYGNFFLFFSYCIVFSSFCITLGHLIVINKL